MVIEFKLPDIGEGIAEAEIVGWFVGVGDHVEEFQPVVEVMTDKTVVEIPAPAAGTITEIRATVGEKVPVGRVIFVLDGAVPAAGAAPAKAAPVAAEHAPLAAAAAPAAGGAGPASRPGPRDGGRILAVPSARRVARELGVDLAGVSGSGRNGVIRTADVQAHAAGPAPAAPPGAAGFKPIAIPPGPGQRRTPFRGLRRRIAEAMVRSRQTAMHFTVVEEVDVTELVALRAKARAMAERDGVKLTYLPFIMRAVAKALARYPELNSQLDEVAQEIVTFSHVHLGIATDTANGLIVPVIRDVQAKGLLQLAAELQDLVERTRAGKAELDELRGSTFSITNAGNIGGTLATPIINFPEVGILGVHRIVKRPGVLEGPEGDRIEVRQYMNLSVSVDHRLTDGANAARFLVEVKGLLEHPGLLAL
ncbi:MAG: dihydrolipoamide acetyltransferase family protein [Planctomycetota bacterium]